MPWRLGMNGIPPAVTNLSHACHDMHNDLNLIHATLKSVQASLASDGESERKESPLKRLLEQMEDFTECMEKWSARGRLDFEHCNEHRVVSLFADSIPSSQNMAPGSKLGTPQPNDLWRFFPSATAEISGEPSSPINQEQPPSQTNFLEEVIKSDAVASSRVKEVMDVLELLETATAWSETRDEVKETSRKWFSIPKASFLVQNVPDHVKTEVAGRQLVQPSIEKSAKEELLQMIPVARMLSAAVYLSTTSKAELLEKCPPKLDRTSADHMSLMHNPDAATLLRLPLGRCIKLLAYGEKCGIVAQHVILKPSAEFDIQKKHPHVTVSFAERVLKKDIAAMKGNGTFDKWAFPLALEGAVGIKMDNGKIIFSDEEFYVETGVDLGAIRKRVVLDKITPSENKCSVTNEAEETQQVEEEEARPSEEIRRLVAHSSFSAKREDQTPDSIPQSPPNNSIRQLQKSVSCSETQSSSIRSPKCENLDCRVLHVGKTYPLLGEPRAPSPSKNGTAERLQETKKRQAELRSECETYRKAAWEEQRKGEEYLDLARAAYREGQREKGDQLNKVSVEASLKCKEHTTKAERLAFEASNLGRINTHTIDLHNLHLQEAIARLKKVADGLMSFVQEIRTAYRLRIITGKGINSVDNVPVLRPAVIEYLKSSGLHAELDEHNEGVVIAYISPPDS